MAVRPVLRVRGFRGVEEVELELAPITIVTGRNNAGKSSLLEAAAIAFTAPAHRLRLAEPDDVINYIFARKRLRGYSELTRDGYEEALTEVRIGKLLFKVALLHPRHSLKAAFYLVDEIYGQAKDSLEECLVKRARSTGYIAIARLAAKLATLFIDYLLMETLREYSQKRGSAAATLMPVVKSKDEWQNHVRDTLSRLLPPSRLRDAVRIVNEDIQKIVETDSPVEKMQKAVRLLASLLFGDSLLLDVNLQYEEMNSIIYRQLRLYLPRDYRRADTTILYDALEPLRDLVLDFVSIELEKMATHVLELEGVLSIVYPAGLLDKLWRCMLESMCKAAESIRERTLKGILEHGYHILVEGVLKPMHSRVEIPDPSKPVFETVLLVRRGRLSIPEFSRIVRLQFESGLLDVFRGYAKRIGIADMIIEEGDVLVLAPQQKEGSKIIIPASRLGDGVLELLQLYAVLTLARRREKPCMLLIEEPESGLHPGYMAEVAAAMARAVREGEGRVYVVFTSHSIEMIRFVLKAARELGILGDTKLVLMRAGRVVSEHGGEEALEALEVVGAELRGI